MNKTQHFGGSVRYTWPISGNNYSLTIEGGKLHMVDTEGDGAGTVIALLPSAMKYQQGAKLATIVNQGLDDLEIRDSGGTEVGTIAAGTAGHLSLFDNATPAGEWSVNTLTATTGGKPLNVICYNYDDPGRCQFGQYDDLNSWPAGYPYPTQPVQDAMYAAGVRYTRAHQSARCAPSRACNLTGRQPHVSSVHPHGTRVGNIPQQDSLTSEFPRVAGVLGAQNPWPKLAKELGAPHKFLHVGKVHCTEWELTDPNDDESYIETAAGVRQIVDEVGFDRAIKTLIKHSSVDQLSGTEPYRGYKGFQAMDMDADSGPTQVHDNYLSPNVGDYYLTWECEKIQEILGAWLTADEEQPFVLHWWTNAGHAILPAIEDAIGPGGASLLPSGDIDFNQQIPYAKDQYGKVNKATVIANASSNFNVYGPGWSEDGVPSGGTVMAPDVDPDAVGFEYGPEGRANVQWRRALAQLESADVIIGILKTWLEDNHPIAAANTLWMIYTDNGVHDTDIVPIYDRRYSQIGVPALGDEYLEVIPPTAEDPDTAGNQIGTVDGLPYHDPGEGKNLVYEEGLIVPLVIWSPRLDITRIQTGGNTNIMGGVDSDQLIDPTDWHPTMMDLLTWTDWREGMDPAEFLKIDGRSFAHTMFDLDNEPRTHGFYQIYSPTYATENDITLWERGISNQANWKIVRRRQDVGDPEDLYDTWELFDLNTDPRENVDLWDSTDADPVANKTELLAAYKAHWGNLN